MPDSLGDRMKRYERAAQTTLPQRMPVILRIDGKAWHTWTRGCVKPFDEHLVEFINWAALAVCDEVQGAQLAFCQSDEISVLVHSYKRFNSCAWFDNRVQKMVSVAASVAAAEVTKYAGRQAHFDARAFVLPEADVCNYFVWRQQDWTRNSIQMLARSLYSQKQCHQKNQSDLQEMIHQAGKNWNDLPTYLKRGRCVVRVGEPGNWQVDNDVPVFTQDRGYIERHLAVVEE